MTLDFTAHHRRESARFAEALRDADPAARVPTCPDWSADDLLYHLAEVFDSWTRVMRDGVSGEDVAAPDRPADRGGLSALYDHATAALLDVIAATPADRPIWSWVAEPVTAAWVPRRMAHEALIHRLDAELTTGSPTAIDATLAADGVHEVLHYFYGWRPSWAAVDTGAPIGRLASTDTGDEWLVRLDTWSGDSPDTGKSYDGVPCPTLVDEGDPSFTIRGTARDLDAWLWNRPTTTAPEVAGDRADYDRLAAVVAQGLQ
jgi:uncharacterized protein (TIGR03083 family)